MMMTHPFLPNPDALLPWEDPLFKWQSATGGRNNLAKAAELESLQQDICGDDIGEVLAANLETAATEMQKRIVQVSQNATQNLMHKTVRVAAGAPLRKRTISERILEPFKKELSDKGFSTAWDGWDSLQEHCEQLVTQAVMAA